MLRAEDSHSSSTARLTPSPQLGQQQQSEQHSNPQRNARCSGLTIRAKRDTFGVEGSYTANLWAGMPPSTRWAVRRMLGIVGSCPHVGRHSILNLVPPTGQWREGSVVQPPTCRSHPGQHRVPWPGDRAGATPTASQQSSPSKSISTHPPPPPCPCPTCPVLWPELSSCLIPALNHSFTLCVRKETAHCQISYLKGNLATFIEPLSRSLDCYRQSL